MRNPAAALAVLLPMTLPLTLSASAFAQTGVPTGPGLVGPRTTGAITEIRPNTPGNDADLVIAPGATGAETVTTTSAASGNSGQGDGQSPVSAETCAVTTPGLGGRAVSP
ncbi:hypothetical protein [Methylobacterium sp. PvR107]|uniref:hypothetical protein n=1 Tax=Methylobacterium sp. PvR107 TaxID=2806597 RepID=UPI001AE265F6|nr:hypothetical protein [Methylobacterium sp. PvR107]MBP1183109.1 hypothetical protein [Methylobacterium sp. PvR107]